MYEQEKINPYRQGEKGAQVEEMFDNIAPTYDTLNHRLSWNIDKYWRRKAIDKLRPYRPKRILDVATGTGDFAIEAARALQLKELLGTDISEGMMQVGRDKVAAMGLDSVIRFQREDCLALSLADDSFDAVTAAFGIRNFQNLEQGLCEMWRVLRKGWPPLRHRADDTRRFPHAPAVLHLFPYRAAPLRPPYFQGHQGLQLSDADHRGLPAGRGHGADPAPGGFRGSLLPASHLRHLHAIFRNQIDN